MCIFWYHAFYRNSVSSSVLRAQSYRVDYCTEYCAVYSEYSVKCEGQTTQYNCTCTTVEEFRIYRSWQYSTQLLSYRLCRVVFAIAPEVAVSIEYSILSSEKACRDMKSLSKNAIRHTSQLSSQFLLVTCISLQWSYVHVPRPNVPCIPGPYGRGRDIPLF